jgi:DNA polymerase
VPGRPSYPGAQAFLPDSSDLDTLAKAAQACRGCDLYEGATQTVFGRGDPAAHLMLVGEQPGDVEDREGRAFVGPAGRLLDRALEEAGIDSGRIYVTNAVKHFHFRVAGKRRIHETPRVGHVTACQPWLRAEFDAVRPRLTVCLGSTAVRSVLGAEVKVMRDRGKVLHREGLAGTAAYLVTVHPSAVLRAPDGRRDEAFNELVADLVAAQAAVAS